MEFNFRKFLHLLLYPLPFLLPHTFDDLFDLHEVVCLEEDQFL